MHQNLNEVQHQIMYRIEGSQYFFIESNVNLRDR